MGISKELLFSGKGCLIEALTINDKCLFRTFLSEELVSKGKNDKDNEEKERIVDFLKLISDSGLPRNVEKFRRLKGDIWEIKKERVRISCYYRFPEKRILLIHGFIKKSQKTPKREIEYAEDKLKRYRQESNT